MKPISLLPLLLTVLSTILFTSCATVVTTMAGVATPILLSNIPSYSHEMPTVEISRLDFTSLSTDKKGKPTLDCEIRYSTDAKKKTRIPFIVYPMNPDGTTVKDAKGYTRGVLNYVKVSKKKTDGTLVSKIPFDMIPPGNKNLNLMIIATDPFTGDSLLVDTGILPISSHIVKEILTCNGKTQPQELMDILFGTETSDGILSTKEDLCQTCHGSGVCQICGGQIVLSCLACDNTGKCNKCEGKGYILDMLPIYIDD